MNSFSIKTGFCLLTLLLVYSSCTKTADGIAGPAGAKGSAGASGQSLPSAITGYVYLTNQYGIDTVHSGVIVSTMKGDTLVQDTTDSLGWFSLPGLTMGSYNIWFKKQGYDSLAQYVIHSGGPEDKFLGNIQMNGTLTTVISSFTYQLYYAFGPSYPPIITTSFNYSGPVQTDTTLTYFQEYLSHSKNVNRYNYDIEETSYPTSNNGSGTNQAGFSFTPEVETVNGNAYNAGDTVYVKIYAVPSPNISGSWYNAMTGAMVTYPYVGDSLLSYLIW